MYSSFLLPYITAPTRITGHSSTLIDNIFSNHISEGNTAGNLITSISDHLAQFYLCPNLQDKEPVNKEIYTQDFKDFNGQNFQQDLQSINWQQTLRINENDIGESFSRFVNSIDALLDLHAPLRKLLLQEQKVRAKPWLTKGIMTSIQKKNRIHKKYIRAKIQTEKKNF